MLFCLFPPCLFTRYLCTEFNLTFMFVVCCTLTHQKSSLIFAPGSSKVMRYKALCFGALWLLLRVLLSAAAAAATAGAAALHRHVCVYCYDFFGGCDFPRF